MKPQGLPAQCAAREVLLRKYGINHTTLQILPASAGDMAHCEHCN